MTLRRALVAGAVAVLLAGLPIVTPVALGAPPEPNTPICLPSDPDEHFKETHILIVGGPTQKPQEIGPLPGPCPTGLLPDKG
jgi:hypothetical protein